jgi:hypothetical protein
MSFSLKYRDVVRKPNPMANINPLARGTGKVVTLEDRVNQLVGHAKWRKVLTEWNKRGLKVDMSRVPKVSLEELGSLLIDEDIQRLLNIPHCVFIADPDLFDPALLQTIQCIKTKDGKFISIDSQHTATVIAGLIQAGFLKGVTDWRKFKFPFQYIETDNLAFARRAFGVLNGKGKKKQSAYQQLRNSVFVVRLDNDKSDPNDVKLEKLVSIAEKNGCYPVEEKHPHLKYAGTFSNIATFKSLTPDEAKLACGWHNKYFHYEGIHANLFFIWRDISSHHKAAKIPVSDKFQHEIAALVQSLFGNLTQYAESAKEAYRDWHKRQYNQEGVWADDFYACGLIQLYVKFGGKEKISLPMFDKYRGAVDFFDNDILALAA